MDRLAYLLFTNEIKRLYTLTKNKPTTDDVINPSSNNINMQSSNLTEAIANLETLLITFSADNKETLLGNDGTSKTPLPTGFCANCKPDE
jgi:hypothetical protein